MVTSTLLLAVLGCAATTYAHVGDGCGGHQVNKRNIGGPLKTYEKRQAPTDEASAAQSTDPSFECSYYSYQPVLDVKPNYPAQWQTAMLMPGDSEAAAIFATVNASVNQLVPDVMPKGLPNGDHTGVVYNYTDPDCWWTWKGCDTPKHAGIPVDITTVPEPNTWGLGFDDGPNCSHNALYDMLYENNQRATMFYIGSNVMNWPLQAMRAIEDGHEVCVHTWSHQYMTAFSNDVAFAELYYTRQIIKDVLGVTPKCWRPPFGDVDDRIRVIADGLNLTTIVWNQDSEDWRIGINNVTAADIDANYEAFIAQPANGTWAEHGTIILNHELNNFTMSEMVKFYPQIKAAYKAVVPIQAAWNVTTPYVEGNLTYPDFAQYTAGQINISTSTGDNINTAMYTQATTAGMATTTSAASASGASGSAAKGGNAAAVSGSSTSDNKTGAAGVSKEVGSGLAMVLAAIGVISIL